ncbi:uncharacterized protein METZ01_LOCUS312339 [marine metagenome]|uniref:Uncharacterized protein n=1 Tax=marine metagenome TaxID=408172 RepID=A0A382NGP7_9ZZZZ
MTAAHPAACPHGEPKTTVALSHMKAMKPCSAAPTHTGRFSWLRLAKRRQAASASQAKEKA